MKKINISLLAAAAVFLGIYGCGDSSTTPTPTPKFYPKSGSQYMYSRSDTDETGTATQSTRTATSKTDTTTYQGKSKVILFVETDGTIVDSTYLTYEANGDVSIYNGEGISGSPIPIPGLVIAPWRTLPIESKTAVTIVSQTNLNIELDLGIAKVKITSVVGTETSAPNSPIIVGAETIDCQVAAETFVIKGTVDFGFPLPLDYTMTTYYYYSAKLGYFAKFKSNRPKVATIAPPNFEQTLTSYTLVK